MKFNIVGFYQNWAEIMGVVHKYLCTYMTALITSITMFAVDSS
jgi:hypothetical protein